MSAKANVDKITKINGITVIEEGEEVVNNIFLK